VRDWTVANRALVWCKAARWFAVWLLNGCSFFGWFPLAVKLLVVNEPIVEFWRGFLHSFDVVDAGTGSMQWLVYSGNLTWASPSTYSTCIISYPLACESFTVYWFCEKNKMQLSRAQKTNRFSGSASFVDLNRSLPILTDHCRSSHHLASCVSPRCTNRFSVSWLKKIIWWMILLVASKVNHVTRCEVAIANSYACHAASRSRIKNSRLLYYHRLWN